jgi:hypothetical protein
MNCFRTLLSDFNLRRSNEARRIAVNEVGRCTLTVSKPVLKAQLLYGFSA